ncbi:peptidoglycan DD-metalloendopeptidase family protein [Salibacterium aidingense]|uniref:peptidoglycan DD-metalloendopeptidase family protein n=1 Tax=Salibacterium aidingense TaxID=384933 RepID=UPI003BE6C3A1
MDKRIQKVRKQVNHKRRKRELMRERGESYSFYPHHSDAPYHEPEFYKWQEQEPQVKDSASDKQKGVWVLQSFLAAIAFLVIGILFQSTHPAFEGAKRFVESSFQEEFPFAMATAWYEERFGSPLAFLPFENDLEERPPQETVNQETEPVAVPVSGTVAESFSENGKGIVLETGNNSEIEAVNGGVVVHTGPHEEWDLAVAVQHYDGGEAWYGMLDNVDVKLYDHVSSGTVLGRVNTEEESGRYSLAIKEDEEYIDPMDVISLD